jgi:hypothetical protein
MRTEDIGTICPVYERANNYQIGGNKKCRCFDMPVDKAKLNEALKEKSKDQCLYKDCLKKLSA